MSRLFSTFTAFRRGRKRFLIECNDPALCCWVWVSLDAAGALSDIELRTEPPNTESMYLIPFRSAPPVVRAISRGMFYAALEVKTTGGDDSCE